MDRQTQHELATLAKRRAEALDRFIEAWRELVALDYRCDVVLDKANTAAK